MANPLKLTFKLPPRITFPVALIGEWAVALVMTALYVLVEFKRTLPVSLKFTFGPVIVRLRLNVTLPPPPETVTVAVPLRLTELRPLPVVRFSPPTVSPRVTSEPPVIVK